MDNETAKLSIGQLKSSRTEVQENYLASIPNVLKRVINVRRYAQDLWEVLPQIFDVSIMP